MLDTNDVKLVTHPWFMRSGFVPIGQTLGSGFVLLLLFLFFFLIYLFYRDRETETDRQRA